MPESSTNSIPARKKNRQHQATAKFLQESLHKITTVYGTLIISSKNGPNPKPDPGLRISPRDRKKGKEFVFLGEVTTFRKPIIEIVNTINQHQYSSFQLFNPT